MLQLFLEALIVGVSISIFGLAIYFIFVNLNDKLKISDNMLVMLSLFITGFIIHLVFEAIGLNKTYCTKGYACLKK